MREIVARLVTAAGFAPFGTVLDTPSGRLTPFNGRAQAEAVVELIAVPAASEPARHSLRLMERHPYSSQAFFPLTPVPYLVAVAPNAPDGGPDTDGLRAFVVPAGTLIQYQPAVWHAPLAALGPHARFAMHVHQDGSAADCEFRDIPPVVIRLEASGHRSGSSPDFGETPSSLVLSS